MSICHIAIPCRDLDEAADFYGARLACRVARRYADRVTFDFFGHQLVCHLSPGDIDPEPSMYPRHFGMTFNTHADYRNVLQLARQQQLAFYREPFQRFVGKREEHSTFFLQDPSNNLIEFKYYNDPEMMY